MRTTQETANISSLDQAFRLSLTEAINLLHRSKITGKELLEELAIIYHRHNIVDLERYQSQTDEQRESFAKVI